MLLPSSFSAAWPNRKCSYCTLYVPMNQFPFFVFCFVFWSAARRASAGLWSGRGKCTWHCGKHAIIRLLPPPAVLHCSWRAAQVGAVDGERARLIRSLLFPSRPHRSRALRSCAHDHATTHFVQTLHDERKTLCHIFFFFFFLTTQGNGCGKLVGWNILEVGGCKYQLSWCGVFFVFVFFFVGQEYWHVGPNHSLTRSATGNHVPITLICDLYMCACGEVRVRGAILLCSFHETTLTANRVFFFNHWGRIILWLLYDWFVVKVHFIFSCLWFFKPP